MPSLRIPQEYETGIAHAKKLSDPEVDKILQILKEASPQTKRSEIAATVHQSIPNLSESGIESFLDALDSLYFIRANADSDIDDFVSDLISGIRRSRNKDIQTTDPEELGRLGERFRLLLTVAPLVTKAKAEALRQDFANIFWDAKVITDIRPIWDGSVSQPPEATVITNTLKLEYHHTGGHGELYVYLDKNDIESLMIVLQRALDKMATLRTLTTAKWMKIIGE